MSLLKLKLNPYLADESILGWQLIEVLAITPSSAKIIEVEGTDTATVVITNTYLCRTELGIMPISSDSLEEELLLSIYVESDATDPVMKERAECLMQEHAELLESQKHAQQLKNLGVRELNKFHRNNPKKGDPK